LLRFRQALPRLGNTIRAKSLLDALFDRMFAPEATRSLTHRSWFENLRGCRIYRELTMRGAWEMNDDLPESEFQLWLIIAHRPPNRMIWFVQQDAFEHHWLEIS
jgi:hypothetical protein